MGDTTVKKIDSSRSPHGAMGQLHLATGKRMSMRLWDGVEPGRPKPVRSREYETLGYVVEGRAELVVEDQKVILEPGDSWVVPAGADHTYHVLDRFTAVEATAPPAPVEARDEPPGD